MNFTREDVSTTSEVAYRPAGDFPKWTVHHPGSYATGFEHLAGEVLTIEKIVFHFGKTLGHWVLREITLSAYYGEDKRAYRERLTDHSSAVLPFWLARLAASAAQEAGH